MCKLCLYLLDVQPPTSNKMKLLHVIALVSIVTPIVQSMILTSVYGGRKKFKTIAFDFLPFLPPFAYETPNKLAFSYNGHHTFRPPNINFKLDIPVPLPVTPFNGLSFAPAPSHFDNYNQAQDAYEAQPSNLDDNEQVSEAQESEEQDTYEEPNESEAETSNSETNNLPAYIKNGNINPDGGSASMSDGAVSKPIDNPRPYTGKAQVSSFIDNGQFVTATKHNGGEADGMFSDHRNGQTDIRRTKTLQLGYENPPPAKTPSYITAHARHPDSLPWAMGYEDLQKYYTTFQFTDGLRGQTVPYTKRKGIFGFNKLFPTIG